MRKDEPGGLEDAPTDSRTVSRRDDGAGTPADDSAASASRHRVTLDRYQFSEHGHTDKYAPITPGDVDDVFERLCRLLGAEQYVDPETVQYVDGDPLELCRTSVSRAIRLLADDDRCPLVIERWSGAASTPTVWRVGPPDEDTPMTDASPTGGDDHEA
jgi:hypothetical protein